jgi:pimeloyl-ACP methyl ester carboxylesterase
MRHLKVLSCVLAAFLAVQMLLYGTVSAGTAPAPQPTSSACRFERDVTLENIKITSPVAHGSQDTLTRNAILVQYPNAQATILICHGFMCDKYDVGFLRSMFPRGQFNFLTFDFRAHGELTSGQCCTFGRDESLDVIAAGKYLRNHPTLGTKPVFVYGFSMGAVASIEAQAKDGSLFDAMILDCPFDSSENVLKKAMEGLRFSLMGYEFALPGRDLLHRYAFHPYVQAFIKVLLKTVAQLDPKNIQIQLCPISPADSIKKIDVPCFFIHCKNDEKIPVDAIRSVYAGAQGYKKLWITNGRRHFDSFFYNPEIYSERVTRFLNNVMNGKVLAKRNKVIEDN